MNRLPDWHTRYVEFIDTIRQTPFEWGKNDCGPMFAGQVIEALTGEPNPAKSHIGKYDSLKTAIKYLKSLGYADMKAAATDIIGEPEHPSRGYIGDVACIAHDSSLGYSLGIVNGERVFFRLEGGIGTLNLLEADCVFKI